jgi:hypothetical protein
MRRPATGQVIATWAGFVLVTILFAAGTAAWAASLVPDTQPVPASRVVTVEKSNPSPELLAFFDSCKQGVEVWMAGQLSYPKDVRLDVGETKSYVAVVDIRENPAPSDEVLPVQGGESTPVAVQCALAARLSPQGDGLRVDEPDWVLRTPTPAGVVNWSWSVTGLKPKGHDLKLELQPAVKIANGLLMVRNTEPMVSSYVTTVNVEGTVIEDFGQWWNENWPILAAIAGATAAGVLALVKWGGDLGQSLIEALGKWRAAPGESPSLEKEPKRRA